jgi:selenocysteine-specific translation elongation factor
MPSPPSGARRRGRRSPRCWPAPRWKARPLFEVSATQGEGVEALHRHLLDAAGHLAARAAAGGFRHAIDRCFTLQGVGLVVTGTAFSGQVSVGDAVTITPPGFTARVRGIHAQDRSAQIGRGRGAPGAEPCRRFRQG